MNQVGSNGKVSFIDDVGKHMSCVVAVRYMDGFKAVVTLTNDCYLTVWTLRSRYGYFPSIAYFLQAQGTCLDVSPSARQAFAGLENGQISAIVMSEDLNYVKSERYIAEHTPLVAIKAIESDAKSGLVISINQKGQLIALNLFNNEVLFKREICLNPHDVVSDHISKVFVSDSSCVITVNFHLEPNRSYITNMETLVAENCGKILRLKFSNELNSLAAGCECGSIFVWRFNQTKLLRYILKWHTAPVTGIDFMSNPSQILSLDINGNFCTWDMSLERDEVVSWTNDNKCANCDLPFFWNLSKMFQMKTLGKRRHHCRSCGRSLCDPCSSHRSTAPSKGWELPVRFCDECYKKVTNSDLTPRIKYSNINTACHISLINSESNVVLASNFYYPIKTRKAQLFKREAIDMDDNILFVSYLYQEVCWIENDVGICACAYSIGLNGSTRITVAMLKMIIRIVYLLI